MTAMNDVMATERQSPGVIAPPPLIATVAVVFGLLLDRLLPAYVLATHAERSGSAW